MSKNDHDRQDSYVYRGVVKRDFKHSHDGPEVARHKSKKKKGCKRNKYGPHEPGDEWHYKASYYRYRACVHCGKELEYQWKKANSDEWGEY